MRKDFSPKIWEKKPWEKVKYPRLGYISKSQFELHLESGEKSHKWYFFGNLGGGSDRNGYPKIVYIEKCEICGKKKESIIKRFKY